MLRMSEIFEPLKPINEARQNLFVRIPLFFFGGALPILNNVFTYDFLINTCPSFLQDMRTLLEGLKKIKIISKEISQQTSDTLKKLETNIHAVKKILNELSESSRVEFVSLLKDERFETYLKSIVQYLQSILNENEYEFELIEVSQIESVDSCVFPKKFDLDNPDASPSLPRDDSLDDWDDSDRRFIESMPSAQPALPVNSDN